MRTYVTTVALLLIALGAPLYAQSTTEAATTAAAAAAGPAPDLFVFDLARPFRLNCTPAAPGVDGHPYTWTVNGSALEKATALVGRVSLEEGGAVLLVSRAADTDHGAYACAARGAPAAAWTLEAHAHAKLPPDSSVVEGQKLKLTCKVIGRPPPPLAWYYRASADDNDTEVSAVFGERASVGPSAAGVAGAELALAAVARSDAGVFTCAPARGTPAHTLLRVKDMYAALWPFLGICAEVLVLCAIILVYEKRRTKPELDDSDTDNHDQ